MTIDRVHSSKYVLIGFEGDDFWEEWHFRFNRGNKIFKPVKCDFNRVWHSDKLRTRISFAGMRWSDSSEKSAEIYFAEHIKQYGGAIVVPDRALIKELTEKFAYKDRSILQ